MAVSIYKRNLQDGKQSIYLRISFRGNTKSEFTGLYTGKGVHKNRESEKKAKEIAAIRHSQLISGEYQISDEFRSTIFNDILNELKSLKSPETQKKYRQLENLLDEHTSMLFRMINQIKESEIKSFIQQLENLGYANPTIYKLIGLMRGIFKYAKEEGLLYRNPMRNVKYVEIRPVKDYLNKDELNLLRELNLSSYVDQINNSWNRSQNKFDLARDLFLFSCYTGLRISDVQTLDQELDLKENRIVKNQFKVKDETVSIPLLPEARAILDKYRSQGKVVFPSISNQRLNKALKSICTLAGIEKHVTFHTARYTFITLMILVTKDVFLVQKLAGHKDIQTTMRYAKLVDGQDIKAMNKFDLFLRN